MTMDPVLRKIPSHRRLDAVKYAMDNRRDTRLKSETASLQWEELPANTGGRTRALMFDPNDPQLKKVWAGAVTGGLWVTGDITDHTAHWRPVDDYWENLAVDCICYDPNDTKTFYVGTGEGQTALTIYRESSGRGTGIMKSTDGGESWESLPSTAGFAYVTDIAVKDQNGTSILLAAVKSGEYKGTRHKAEPSNGLFLSNDGGETWAQVLPDIPGTEIPYSVAEIEIASNGRIFAGTDINLDWDGGGTILYSDDCLSWETVDQFIPVIEQLKEYNIPGRVILASAPTDPDRIYALFSSRRDVEGFLYGKCFVMARSDDGGQTWTELTVPYHQLDPEAPVNWAYISWHALIARVHPENPDIVYIGGCDNYGSIDAGVSWEWISSTEHASLHTPNTYQYVHADQHNLLFQPGSSDLMINANDGGVFICRDASDPVLHWEERNESFNTMQFYTCAIHPEADKIHYLGGTQDNSTMLYNSPDPVTDDGNRWLGGDGAYCFIDQDEPDIQMVSIQWNYYGISTDGLEDPDGLFINPSDYDYINNILYANATTMYGDYPDNLLVIMNIPDEPVGYFFPTNTGSRLAFSCVKVLCDEESTIVFAGTQTGKLYKFLNPATRPVPIEIGSMDFPYANISGIDVSPNEEEIVVTFSNYGVSSVWYTFSGGVHWSEKEGNLPDMPVRWGILHPLNSNHVMIATEVGVWTTDNIEQEEVIWTPELDGLANVRVDMLKVRESDFRVIAATHGRGMYQTYWHAEPKYPSPVPEAGDVLLYPNPSSGLVTIGYHSQMNVEMNVRVYDTHGRLQFSKDFMSYIGELEKSIDLSHLAPGTYVCEIRIGAGTWSKYLILFGQV